MQSRNIRRLVEIQSWYLPRMSEIFWLRLKTDTSCLRQKPSGCDSKRTPPAYSEALWLRLKASTSCLRQEPSGCDSKRTPPAYVRSLLVETQSKHLLVTSEAFWLRLKTDTSCIRQSLLLETKKGYFLYT